MKHLDLGCGNNPRNPYRADELYGADIHPSVTNLGPNFKQANLAVDALRYDSNFFDSVSAYDVLETAHRDLKIKSRESMMRPGALITAAVPSTLQCPITPNY
jgi:hypothetical protein